MADYTAKHFEVDEKVLKSVPIHARDLNDAWHRCLFELVNGNGYVYKIDKGSYEKTEWRLEFDHVSINVAYPGTKPIIPTTREGIPPPTGMDYIENTYIVKLLTGERGSGEDYTYGERIVEPAKFLDEAVEEGFKLKKGFENRNQMLQVIHDFRTKGHESNQEVMQIASPLDLWKGDPPCLRHIFCRIRYDKLHFITSWRSWDLWGGMPSNLGGFQYVKDIMAAEIGVEDGGMISDSSGLHLYTQSWEVAAMEINVPIEKWKARNVEDGGLKRIHDEYRRIQEKSRLEKGG